VNALWPQIITAVATLAAALGTLVLADRRETRNRRDDRHRDVYMELTAAARAVLDFTGHSAVPEDISNRLYLAVTAVQIAGSRRAAAAAGAVWNAAKRRLPAALGTLA
jgi:hypothetical protein